MIKGLQNHSLLESQLDRILIGNMKEEVNGERGS